MLIMKEYFSPKKSAICTRLNPNEDALSIRSQADNRFGGNESGTPTAQV